MIGGFCAADVRDFEPSVIIAEAVDDLLAAEIPPRTYVLEPIIPTQGLVMLHAHRGTGKTLIAMAIAYAVASGSRILRWQAPHARRVLYIDGEMPAVVLRDRFSAIKAGATADLPDPDFLRIVTPDRQSVPIPDLALPDGQLEIERLIEGAELVVLDNLSALCRTGVENDAEYWVPIQSWLLSLRRRGVAVLIVHHSGKGGQQRGTSKREDLLDTVIGLKRPSDYRPDQGARFEVHVEKGRAIHGEDAKPFEVNYAVDAGAAMWTMKSLDDTLTERVADMVSEGLSHREIAKRLSVGVGTVSRHRRRAKEFGLVTPETTSK